MHRLATDTLAIWQCFTILGLFGIYLKAALLGPEWGAIARYLGHQTPTELTTAQRLGFFASDIVINLIIVPLVGTIATSVIFRRYRVAAAVVVAMALSIGYFVEIRAYSEVGQFVAGDVVRDGIGWALTSPSSVIDYVTFSSVVKLGVLLAWFTAIAVAARASRRAEATAPARAARHRWWLGGPAAAVAIAAIVLAPIAWASRLAGSPLNASAVGRALAALRGPGDDDGGGTSRTPAESLAALHELMGTESADAAHPFVGREADADVLIFFMETGPAQALDFVDHARTLPGASRLYPRAFIGREHYTAHPYSSDATFSLLSGSYPQARRRVLNGDSAASMPGLFASLPSAIGHRGVYLPSLYRIELDDRMYTTFGARTLYIADQRPDDPLAARAAARAEALVVSFERDGGRFAARTRHLLVERLRADLQALERLKADLASTIAARRRYAVMFFPEIGHGPWPSLRGETDVLARGHALMRLQGEWLDEILDVIGGRLDRTVVVVTADHGLRTRAEYPSLPVGFLSDVMFRVPLLVHAPRTVSVPTVLTAPTSHVDLAPTVLSLVGESSAAARMAGVPVWQRRPSQRIYLLGSAYGGADGFVEGGQYYMRQALSGAVYASDRLAFDRSRPLQPSDPRTGWVTDGLARAGTLQHALSGRATER